METPREYRKHNRLLMLLAGIVLFAMPLVILARPTGTHETTDGQKGKHMSLMQFDERLIDDESGDITTSRGYRLVVRLRHYEWNGYPFGDPFCTVWIESPQPNGRGGHFLEYLGRFKPADDGFAASLENIRRQFDGMDFKFARHGNEVRWSGDGWRTWESNREEL